MPVSAGREWSAPMCSGMCDCVGGVQDNRCGPWVGVMQWDTKKGAAR